MKKRLIPALLVLFLVICAGLNGVAAAQERDPHWERRLFNMPAGEGLGLCEAALFQQTGLTIFGCEGDYATNDGVCVFGGYDANFLFDVDAKKNLASYSLIFSSSSGRLLDEFAEMQWPQGRWTQELDDAYEAYQPFVSAVEKEFVPQTGAYVRLGERWEDRRDVSVFRAGKMDKDLVMEAIEGHDGGFSIVWKYGNASVFLDASTRGEGDLLDLTFYTYVTIEKPDPRSAPVLFRAEQREELPLLYPEGLSLTSTYDDVLSWGRANKVSVEAFDYDGGRGLRAEMSVFPFDGRMTYYFGDRETPEEVAFYFDSERNGESIFSPKWVSAC